MNKNTLLGLAAAACLITVVSVPAFADGAAAATCKDGTTSTTTGKGACSHHGGVNKSAPAAAAPATPAPAAAPAPAAPAPAAAPKAAATKATPAAATTATAAGAPAGSTAKCKDGTYSKSKTRSGTCSRHGGVDTWLTS